MKKNIMIFVVTFTTHYNEWCDSRTDQGLGTLDTCKELCAGRDDCAGVGFLYETCFVMPESCKGNLRTSWSCCV